MSPQVVVPGCALGLVPSGCWVSFQEAFGRCRFILGLCWVCIGVPSSGCDLRGTSRDPVLLVNGTVTFYFMDLPSTQNYGLDPTMKGIWDIVLLALEVWDIGCLPNSKYDV